MVQTQLQHSACRTTTEEQTKRAQQNVVAVWVERGKQGGRPLGEEGDEVQEGCQQRLARRLRPAAPRCAGLSGAPRLAGCGVGRGRGQGGMA